MRSSAVEGAPASSNSFDDNEATSQKPPPPRFAWSPSPLSRGRKASTPGLTARFLFAREFFIPPFFLTLPLALFPGFSLCPPRPQTKGEAERRETRKLTRALRARGALCGARSPLGVPLRLWPGRQLVPKARHQAMLPRSSPERSVLYGRLNREAETLRFAMGVTRAGKTNYCPRTASTSHAGRCAGRMMPDAARERVTNPPAGTALAPSQGVSSRRTSLRKAR